VAPLTRLLLGAWARALALAHGGGVLLLALVVLTESTANGGDPLVRLTTELPHTWALLAPALTLVGAALAVSGLRRRGDWLALASLGVPESVVLRSALGPALLLALLAGGVEGLTEPIVTILRVPGGWLVEGTLRLDPGAAAPPADVLAAARWAGAWRWPGTGLLLLAAAPVGAVIAARSRGTAVLVAAFACVVLDLLRRGAPPATGSALAAGLFLAGLASAGFAIRERRGAG
jgi:hypothetical protein